jgi:hypothetical protein
VQTNIVPVNTGRKIPHVESGWANNATLGVAGPIIVDGVCQFLKQCCLC